jgi:hypothetical protein
MTVQLNFPVIAGPDPAIHRADPPISRDCDNITRNRPGAEGWILRSSPRMTVQLKFPVIAGPDPAIHRAEPGSPRAQATDR